MIAPMRTDDPRATSPDPPSRQRVIVRRSVEIFALSGLAVAQPLLDIFGKAPEHFVLRGVDRGGILAFALIVTFAPPLVLSLVGVLTGFVSAPLSDTVHSATIGVLAVIA